MADSPAYQSGLIAALRGSSPNDAPTTPGIQFLPNAPMAPFNPMSFGAPQMRGNLMTPPSMPRAPSYSPPGQQAFTPPPMTGNLMPTPSIPSAPSYMPTEQQPFVLPPMTGNLMPAPDMPRAPDYVPPPPPPAPVQPPAPQINYEMDDEGNRTGAIIGINAENEPYRYFPSLEQENNDPPVQNFAPPPVTNNIAFATEQSQESPYIDQQLFVAPLRNGSSTTSLDQQQEPFYFSANEQPFVLPPMTGNLMPAPDMPRAPDYAPPPPPPPPAAPPAPQINYEMDEEGNRTGAIIGVGPDGEPYRYFPSFE